MTIPRAYVASIASGATQTFSDVISMNAVYNKLWVYRSSMASVATIYPQISVTGITGTFRQMYQSGAVVQHDTAVSGYFVDTPVGFQYLRFEVASLPTNGLKFNIIASEV